MYRATVTKNLWDKDSGLQRPTAEQLFLTSVSLALASGQKKPWLCDSALARGGFGLAFSRPDYGHALDLLIRFRRSVALYRQGHWERIWWVALWSAAHEVLGGTAGISSFSALSGTTTSGGRCATRLRLLCGLLHLVARFSLAVVCFGPIASVSSLSVLESFGEIHGVIMPCRSTPAVRLSTSQCLLSDPSSF
jgi:hypothetical protein